MHFLQVPGGDAAAGSPRTPRWRITEFSDVKHPFAAQNNPMNLNAVFSLMRTDPNNETSSDFQLIRKLHDLY